MRVSGERVSIARLVHQKEPWMRYGVKVSAIFLAMVVAGSYFIDRYRIGVDSQVEKCLPGYTFFLVDTWDKNLVRDRIYSFGARGMMPFFPDGTRIAKVLRGVPGDTVGIDQESVIRINGSEIGRGLPLAAQLERKEASFHGSTTLPEGRYWFMGVNPVSFDSRYWGAVHQEQIVGRAYPLF